MRQAIVPLLLTLIYSSALFAENSTPDLQPLQKEDETQWYQADIIVFRNESAKTSTTEKWPEARFRPAPQNAIKLSPANTLTVSGAIPDLSALYSMDQNTQPTPDLERDPFVELPDKDLLLNERAATLSRSPNYTVLAKMAWRLPVSPDQKEKPVLIESPVDSSSTYMLSGSVAVSASRFLHVDVDLWYNELRPEALSAMLMHKEAQVSPDVQSLQHSAPLRVAKSFQLKERRRIQRNSKIQYLDSPVIGILLKLTPYEVPVATGLMINTTENI